VATQAGVSPLSASIRSDLAAYLCIALHRDVGRDDVLWGRPRRIVRPCKNSCRCAGTDSFNTMASGGLGHSLPAAVAIARDGAAAVPYA